MSRPNKRPHTRSAGIILYYGPKFNTEMGKISDFQALHAIPSPLLQAPGNVEKWAAPQAGARADLPQQCTLKKGTGTCTGDGGGVCAMSVARRLVCTYHFLRLRAALIAPEAARGIFTPFHGRESFAPRAVQALYPPLSLVLPKKERGIPWRKKTPYAANSASVGCLFAWLRELLVRTAVKIR